MNTDIRMYSKEELLCHNTDWIVNIFLERQNWIQEMLNEYMDVSKKLQTALERINLLNAKLYGKSTETSRSLGIKNTKDDLQKKEDAEVSNERDTIVEEKTVKNSATQNIKRPKRATGCMKQQRANLPIIEVDDVLEKDQLIETFGTDKISELPVSGYDIIHMRPAYCYVEHHNVHVYKKGKTIVRAQNVKKLLPHSDISSSTLAYIFNARYALNLPGNRISMELERNNYPMSRQRIYSLTEHFAFKAFELVVERMKQVMFASGHIQADETPVTMNEKRNNGQVTQSRIWAYLTSERNEPELPRIVIYQYELTRATDKLKSFINGFSGTITSDGYISYRNVDKDTDIDVKVSGCMTHARRKYADALKAISGFKALSEEEKNKYPAYVALKLIAKIFTEDKKLNQLEPKDRLQKRQSIVKPLVDDFFKYIHSLNEDEFDKSNLTYTAVKYTKNQEPYLRLFLSDGHIPLENSAAERAIITLALGRNSWKTIATIDGATATGYMYSIAETAKRNGCNPYYYFKYLLEYAEHLQAEHKDEPITNLEYMDVLMPWSEAYKKYEKAELEHEKTILDIITTNMNTKNT